jgi:hypothetical protein
VELAVYERLELAEERLQGWVGLAKPKLLSFAGQELLGLLELL